MPMPFPSCGNAQLFVYCPLCPRMDLVPTACVCTHVSLGTLGHVHACTGLSVDTPKADFVYDNSAYGNMRVRVNSPCLVERD